MRRVREVLRLRHALGMSDRSIAQSLGIGKTTVGEYVCRAKVIGITWPVPEEIDDAELERRLFTAPSFEEKPKRPPLDWPRLHEELPQTDDHAFDELVRNPKRYPKDNSPGQHPRSQKPARPQEPVR